MLDIFNYDFMIKAFIAGITVGIVAPLVGTFLVAKRYSLIADSLAHISLAGIAVGIVIGVSPIASALVFAILAALLVEKLRSGKQLSGEVALAMFLSSGLAITVVLIGVANNIRVDLFSLLFGSITTVQMSDLYVIVPLGIAVFATIIFLYKELVYVSFDDESAKVSGIPANRLNQLLVILTAITVVLSLRIVGGLLIGALMVIPVAAAMQVAKSFKQTAVLAIVFGLLSVIAGLFAAFYWDLAAGGSIVIAALLLFICALVWRILPSK